LKLKVNKITWLS